MELDFKVFKKLLETIVKQQEEIAKAKKVKLKKKTEKETEYIEHLR